MKIQYKDNVGRPSVSHKLCIFNCCFNELHSCIPYILYQCEMPHMTFVGEVKNDIFKL